MEVAKYVEESQFENNESAYLCGFFAVALNKAAGKTEPLHSGEWVDLQADAWAVEVTGLANYPGNKVGMSLLHLYYTLHLAGLHYQQAVADLRHIRAWVGKGYPVLITVDERSVFDVEIQDKVPYSWKPSGSHILTVSGLAGDNLLCRDPANIGPDGLRPSPREYDAGKLSISAATAVVLPWLARPAAGYDPTVEEQIGSQTENACCATRGKPLRDCSRLSHERRAFTWLE